MLYWGFAFEAYNGRLFNGERSMTTAGNLPKPILSAMELFEKTGDTVLKTDGVKNGGPMGLLATADAASGKTVQLIAYHFDEQAPEDGTPREVSISIEALDGREVSFECYKLDRTNSTYGEWVRQGCPETPDKADMDALMAAASPVPTTFSVPITDGRAEVKLTLEASSMVMLCGKIN